MRSFTQLLALVSLVVSASAAATTANVPNKPLLPVNPVGNRLNLQNTNPNFDAIFAAVRNVNTRAITPTNATVVIAVDGKFTNTPLNSFAETGGLLDRYEVVFEGTGVGPDDRDGSINGDGYQTFTLVSNSTYNVDACLNFCDSVQGCVFANLFYEKNNIHLDLEETSNLKCAVYDQIHTAAEKTNRGQQQSYPPPAPLVFIQNSTGYALRSLVEPPTPEGYEFVFGPINASNDAPGFMSFVFTDKYDVNACAQLCNSQTPDVNGGACQYFNIWQGSVNSVPTVNACGLYFIPTDQSTAVIDGANNLEISMSRGYRRKTLVPDGDFESFDACSAEESCFTESDEFWIGSSPPGGDLDAEIVRHEGFGHSGASAASLGSGFGSDDLPGTIKPASKLDTIPGRTYVITFFHSSSFGTPDEEVDAFMDVMWNGQIMGTIRPGFSDYKYFEFRVTATGNDELAFHGGKAPAWSFIDDVFVFLA